MRGGLHDDCKRSHVERKVQRVILILSATLVAFLGAGGVSGAAEIHGRVVRIADGDTLTLGHHRLQVLHTPGHSPGSVVLWCQEEGVAFTGDTLFRMSVGRTDLPGGSFDDLCRSLQRLARLLPQETRLLTGHGPATLMSDELRYNPYLR